MDHRLLWMLFLLGGCSRAIVQTRSIRVSCLCCPLLAQTSTTSVRGTVTDPSGALVPNAQISLTNTATTAVINGTSDKSGLYQFPQLAPAHLSSSPVTRPGFAPSTKQAQLLVNQPATINFQFGVSGNRRPSMSAPKRRH